MTDDNHETHRGQAVGEAALPAKQAPLTEAQAADKTRQRIRHLPSEVGVVLVTAGVAGLILPGPMGTPLVLAGGLVLAPRAFDRIERWVQTRFPTFHQLGRRHLDRFIDDFENRFPAAKTDPAR